MNQESTKKKKSGGFESMGLIPPVYQAIKKKGYNVPTPIQRKAIPLILAGHDVVACSKTGSGKTAAFVIPMVNKLQEHSSIVGIRAIIMLPTRELALQTASVLKQFVKFTNLVYTLMVGGHGFEGQFESLAQNPDILIATPGRLLQHLEENRLKLTRVEIVTFDEADYLFDMGLADQLKSILHYLPQTRQALIFSATIPEQLSMFAQVGLRDYVYVKLDKEFTLPETMMVNFLIVSNDNKLSALIYLLKQKVEGTTIIFASTKYLVDLIVYVLEKFGIHAVNIYGKMDHQDRKLQLDEFRYQRCNVLVVTDLASRGIDLPFVNNVIHYDYPAKPKIFIHRSGRTARAGKAGSVYTLLASDELFFIAETMLFAGRKLDYKGELNDTSKALYGRIPIDLIMLNQEKINVLGHEDPEFIKMLEVSGRANERFRKTRGSASRASIRRCKEIEIGKVHPMFADETRVDQDTQDYMDAIKNFKCGQSYIEIKKLQQLRQNKQSKKDMMEGKKKDLFLSAVSQLKRIEQESKKRQKMKKIRVQQEQNEIEKEMESSDEEYSDNNQEQVEEDKQVVVQRKKMKRSEMKSFADPEFYVSGVQDVNHKSEFDELRKIGMNDINAYVLAEDNEGLAEQKKKFAWDSKKKRYVKAQPQSEKSKRQNESRDKDDKGMNRNKGVDSFKKWSKSTQLEFQRVGEDEDTLMVNRAKEMFKRRQMRGKGYYFNDEEPQQRNVRSELKSTQQLLKSKKIKKNLKLKNMEKPKRRQIERRMRNQ